MNGVYRITVAGKTVRRSHSIRLAARLREVWNFRFLLRHLVARDLKVKYKRSTLGFVWTFLNPLATVLVLIAVFRLVVRIEVEHYWAFLLSGYFAWNAASQSILAASYTFAEHGRLARSVTFPTEILVVASAGSRLVEFAAESAILLLVLAVAHHGGVPASFLFLPVVVCLQAMILLGVMFPVATLSTLYRDVVHALPVAVTTLFYVSPVFYPADLVPGWARPWYFVNPLAGLLTLYHRILYEGVAPSPALLLGTTAQAAVILGLGYAIFLRYQNACIELS